MGLMTNDRVALTRDGQSLVDHIFYETLMSIERLSSHKMLLSVQNNLNELKGRIVEFINNNPYSIFEIAVLLDKDDTDKISSAIKVKNFDTYLDGSKPRRF